MVNVNARSVLLLNASYVPLQTVTIKDADGEDVTDNYTSGSASASGDVITTSTILDLVADAQYRLEIKFTVNGNVLEAWADLRGEA